MEEDPAHSAGDDDDHVETDQTGEDRDRAAEARDRKASAHDKAAVARDGRATARDERAEARERAGGGVDKVAAAFRTGASRNRAASGTDRTFAAEDRRGASTDRVFSAQLRVASSIEGLTGARRRDAGIMELRREVARAKRTGQPFALAFVDINGLKARNDALGHAAGDQLLRETANAIRAHLRPYDLIIRYGGDEFVCGLLDVSMAAAANRFSLVNADLAAGQHASVTVGLAELEANDTLEDLIARADTAMYNARQQPGSTGG